MFLLTNLSRSIYGPQFYPALLKEKMSFSFKYFFGFIAAFSLLVTIVGVIVAGSSLTSSNLSPHLAKYEALFPDNLVIMLKGGEASANVKMPFFIDPPADSVFSDNKDAGYEHLFVIDTTQSASLELFQKYNTLALLTKDALVTDSSSARYDMVGNKGIRGDGQIRITPLKTFPDGKLDKPMVSTIFQKIKSFLPFLLPLLFPFLFGFVFVFMAIELVYLFLGGLFIWIVLRIMKVKAGYWKSYQIGLHAMTLPLILSVAFFRLPQLKFPFWFTVIMLIVVICNVRAARHHANHS